MTDGVLHPAHATSIQEAALCKLITGVLVRSDHTSLASGMSYTYLDPSTAHEAIVYLIGTWVGFTCDDRMEPTNAPIRFKMPHVHPHASIVHCTIAT